MTHPVTSGESVGSSSRRGYGPGFWCAITLMAIALYVGAYYALAHTNGEYGTDTYQTANHIYFVKPDYFPYPPAVNDALRCFFLPIHLIDLKIRKDRWRA